MELLRYALLAVFARSLAHENSGILVDPAQNNVPPHNASPPTLRFTHPREGGFVTADSRSVVDLATSLRLPQSGWWICLELSIATSPPSAPSLPPSRPESRPCYADFSSARFFRAPRPGPYSLVATLERWAPGDERPSEVAARAAVSFAAESPGAAAGRFARAPFMVARGAHCARFTHFRFALYPQQWLPSLQAASLYYALLQHPLRTEDAAQACVLVGLTDVKAANQVREPLEASAARLARLPLWGSGENHIVLHYGDYAPGFDVQRAILAASSFGPPYNRSFFRPEDPEALPQLPQERAGFDVVMPMAFYRCGYSDEQAHLHKFDRYYDAREQSGLAERRGGSGEGDKGGQGSEGDKGKVNSIPGMDVRERPYLLTFKGALYDMPQDHHAFPRLTLRSLHNGQDIVIALHCWALAPDCAAAATSEASQPLRNYSTSSASQCATLTAEAANYDFESLMLRSRFSAVLPGEGTHSYRLYEALQAGAIPVLIGASARPLEPLIKWSEVAIIHEDSSPLALQFLEAQLRLISTATLEKIQRKGRAVFFAHLADLNVQLSSLLALLAHRFDATGKALVAEEEVAKATKMAADSVGASRDAAAAVAATAVVARLEAASASSTASAMPPSSPGIQFSASFEPPPVFRGNPSETPNADRELFSIHDEESLLQISHSRLKLHSHLLSDASSEVSSVAALVAPMQRAQLRALVAHEGGNTSEISASDVDIRSSRSILKDRQDLHFHAARAIELYLEWLERAVPSAAERAIPHVRPAVANVYSLLSQVYGILGQWRHASTAVQALLFHYGTERGAQQQEADTRRARNTMFDLRRSPGDRFEVLEGASVGVGRVLDTLSNIDNALLAGWGALAHYTGPAPLTCSRAHAFPFPLFFDEGSVTHPTTRSHHVLATSSDAQLIADSLELQTALGICSLHDYRERYKLRHVLAHSMPLNDRQFPSTKTANVAIVSLCAYPASASNNSLTFLSRRNLQAYCEAHSYDCFLATASLDASRPTAWSKVLLVAHFLPRYEWVVWRDCDSFFMRADVSVEDLLEAAAHARGKVASATEKVLGDKTESAQTRHSKDGNGVIGPLSASDYVAAIDKDAPYIANRFGQSAEAHSSLTTHDSLLSVTDLIFRAQKAVASREEVFDHDSRNSSAIPTLPITTADAPPYISRTPSQTRAVPLFASPIDLIVSEDGLMLNTGVWALRRSPWSLSWLRRVYGDLTDPSPSSLNISQVSGGEGLGASSTADPDADAALAAEALRSMRRPALNQSPLVQNRMWEQGGALWQFVNRDVPLAARNNTDASHGQSRIAPASLALRYEDLVHTQFVPQRWLNSYPERIAGALRDHRQRPMHAAFERGDWIASFSGCTGFFGTEACDALYLAFAKEAVGGV